MSFLKKLFGGGSSGGDEAKPTAEMTHEGYHVLATPMKEGGQFRLCAVISREVDGEMKSHKLIRADVFSNADQASDMAFQKAK